MSSRAESRVNVYQQLPGFYIREPAGRQPCVGSVVHAGSERELYLVWVEGYHTVIIKSQKPFFEEKYALTVIDNTAAASM